MMLRRRTLENINKVKYNIYLMITGYNITRGERETHLYNPPRITYNIFFYLLAHTGEKVHGALSHKTQLEVEHMGNLYNDNDQWFCKLHPTLSASKII